MNGSVNLVFLVLRRMRTPLVVLLVSYSIAILGFVLIPGVDEEGRRWRMDFFHAFYFVSYTGSTIGFGELPAAFSPAQRMWAVFTIYLTVVSWVYALGKILTLVQDAALRRALTQRGFIRSVRRLAEPFVLVCGYGDTGRLVVHSLVRRGLRPVVIDILTEQIDLLNLEETGASVPGLQADAGRTDTLTAAGLCLSNCTAVVALTGSDRVNLKIAITAKLLNESLPIIARADLADTAANMASFGTNHIINAFDIFADRFALALHSPNLHLIHEWLTAVPDAPLSSQLCPPHGAWILCGYGRFGKAVYERLMKEGLGPLVIVEENPRQAGCEDRCVAGLGTEASTLMAAGADKANGIVAGTNDDTNNLSIIITARELNPTLFSVCRQNEQENSRLFEAAQLDLVMNRPQVLAKEVFTWLTKPMLVDFLQAARERDERWAHELGGRIRAVSGDLVPEVWGEELTFEHAPAVFESFARGEEVTVEDLLRDPRMRSETLPCVPLLLFRKESRVLLPPGQAVLLAGDRLLLCGPLGTKRRMAWGLRDPGVLAYLRGEGGG